MKVHMDEAMFDALVETSMEWGERWRDKLDRFEGAGVLEWEPPELSWGMAYWVGTNPASMILARSWLLEQDEACQVVWDMAEHAEGDWFGYVLLTHYRTTSWRKETV